MQNYKKKAESFRVKLVVVRQNWIKQPDQDYGIYQCSLAETPEKEVKTTFKGLFNIKGTIPYLLKEGKSYVVYLYGNPEYNAQFKNYTYNIDKFETEQLTLPEEQFEFLSTVTTPAIYEQFEKLYPDQAIIDLIFDNQIDLSKINGLAEKTFEKLKEKLEMYRDLGKLQNMLKPLGVSIRSIKKIAQHFQNPDAAYYKLKESLYNLCEVKGFGFAKVDEIALKGGTEPTDELRIKYCLGYLLEQGANDGHSWAYREELKVEALDLLQIEPHYIDDLYSQCGYEKGEYYHHSDIIMVGELISTFGMYFDERNVLDNLDRIDKEYIIPNITDEMFDEEIARVEQEVGFEYTDEQRFAIKESFKHGVYIIVGGGGSGKSTLVKAIAHIQERFGVKTIGCALSGKASLVIANNGIEAATIHRTLGFTGDEFTYNSSNPLEYNWINADEAGMNNASLWNSLLSAIPSGGQILLTGDNNQLSAIGAGDVLRDLLNSKRYNKTMLTKIHRQAAESGVIEIANKIKDGEQLTSYNQEINEIFGVKQDLQIMTINKPKKDEVILSPLMSEEEQKETLNPIYQTAKEFLNYKINQILLSDNPEYEIMDFQVICPIKKNGQLSVDSINNYIQSLYNKNKESITKNGTEFKKGDKIIISGNKYKINGYSSINNYLNEECMTRPQEVIDECGNTNIENVPVTFDLYNGTLGIIKGCYPDKQEILVKFDNIEGLISIHEEDMGALDLGYAISLHKSQGSGFHNILILFDFSSFKLLSKQLIYTGLTRLTKGKAIMMCEGNALIKGISTDTSMNRRTFLSLLLEHLDNMEEE